MTSDAQKKYLAAREVVEASPSPPTASTSADPSLSPSQPGPSGTQDDVEASDDDDDNDDKENFDDIVFFNAVADDDDDDDDDYIGPPQKKAAKITIVEPDTRMEEN